MADVVADSQPPIPPTWPTCRRGRMLGLTGAPGRRQVDVRRRAGAGAGAVAVPMDGFHLADVELRRRGLLDRKGAPETFDAEGYAALLRAGAAGAEPLVMAPAFERDLEQPLAGAIAVPGSADQVVDRGQLPAARRAPVARRCATQLDAVWHLHVDDDLRRERLVARHVAFGKTPDEARAWVARVDERQRRARRGGRRARRPGRRPHPLTASRRHFPAEPAPLPRESAPVPARAGASSPRVDASSELTPARGGTRRRASRVRPVTQGSPASTAATGSETSTRRAPSRLAAAELGGVRSRRSGRGAASRAAVGDPDEADAGVRGDAARDGLGAARRRDPVAHAVHDQHAAPGIGTPSVG